MPGRRRRRKTNAVAVEAERGFAMRVLMHSPKDVIAGGLAFAAVSAIVTNALFLQAGRHPAPMFGSSVAVPAAALSANPADDPRDRGMQCAQSKLSRSALRITAHRAGSWRLFTSMYRSIPRKPACAPG